MYTRVTSVSLHKIGSELVYPPGNQDFFPFRLPWNSFYSIFSPPSNIIAATTAVFGLSGRIDVASLFFEDFDLKVKQVASLHVPYLLPYVTPSLAGPQIQVLFLRIQSHLQFPPSF